MIRNIQNDNMSTKNDFFSNKENVRPLMVDCLSVYHWKALVAFAITNHAISEYFQASVFEMIGLLTQVALMYEVAICKGSKSSR